MQAQMIPNKGIAIHEHTNDLQADGFYDRIDYASINEIAFRLSSTILLLFESLKFLTFEMEFKNSGKFFDRF